MIKLERVPYKHVRSGPDSLFRRAFSFCPQSGIQAGTTVCSNGILPLTIPYLDGRGSFFGCRLYWRNKGLMTCRKSCHRLDSQRHGVHCIGWKHFWKRYLWSFRYKFQPLIWLFKGCLMGSDTDIGMSGCVACSVPEHVIPWKVETRVVFSLSSPYLEGNVKRVNDNKTYGQQMSKWGAWYQKWRNKRGHGVGKFALEHFIVSIHLLR